mmetsp:Transcript_104033/g.303702  ORF Transcript_104033/g.303702 Transcript_104033/m.303702 type:complete len:412 (-) Transcript_104033:359-1594(-)
MQTLTIYQNTAEGLQLAGPEHGPESGRLVRHKAVQELEQKSVLQSMQDNAVRCKEQGNAAMAQMEYRHAIREYSQALTHAHAMMDFLEVDRPPPMNGYQLRALARGQPLPKRGPEALDPFRALVHANRALAFLRLDAYERAINDASESCRLLPRYLKAWVRRATALAAADRREEALTVLDEALEKACPDAATKEQVCKLIVNVRALGDVQVRPPERDLPVVSAAERKRGAAKKEVVQVPRQMMESSQSKEEEEDSTSDCIRQGDVERDRRRLEALLKAEWHPTHLGGRWRQSFEEVIISFRLPRRPKASELLVQIRLQRVWVMLRKPDAVGDGGRDDYETVCDAQLLRAVKPSESTWSLEGDAQAELFVFLQKQNAGISVDGTDGVSPLIWDRAFEEDVPVGPPDLTATSD